MMSESILLSNLTAREFGEIFLEHKQGFIRTAYRYVRDQEVAADLVSDSFMSFWEARATISDTVNIPAYIFTIVKNKCLNHLRAKSQHLHAEQDMQQSQLRLLQADIASLKACNPEELFQSEIFEILRRALDKMPDKTQQVFMKSRFSDMSYNDIARDMDISFTNVHFEMRRSLVILRAEFRDYLIIFIISVFCSI